MRYTLLGPSGLRVSELSLGTMTFGEDWGWGADKDTSRAMVDDYAEAGGNFIDTADLYTNGTSERFVGDFIAADRDYWVLATKYTLSSRPGDPNAGGNHRKRLIHAVDASLKRLNTAYIDLLWVHAWDDNTPVEETLRGLDDLVRQGKVFYIGFSDVPAWVVAKANMMAALRGWTPFVALQLEYSLIERTIERELVPFARSEGLSILPWSPLAGGLLSGKFGTNKRPQEGRLVETSFAASRLNERNFTIADTVSAVAAEIGASASQVAIAWTMQSPARRGFAGMIPILGARKLDHLKDNMAATDVTLSDGHLDRLDEASAIDRGFPYDFLSTVTGMIHGEHRNRLHTTRPHFY